MNTFKRLRIRSEKSQKQVAHELGTDHAVVSKWESGRHNPRPERLGAIARVLNCTVDELLAEEQKAGR